MQLREPVLLPSLSVFYSLVDFRPWRISDAFRPAVWNCGRFLCFVLRISEQNKIMRMHTNKFSFDKHRRRAPKIKVPYSPRRVKQLVFVSYMGWNLVHTCFAWEVKETPLAAIPVLSYAFPDYLFYLFRFNYNITILRSLRTYRPNDWFTNKNIKMSFEICKHINIFTNTT